MKIKTYFSLSGLFLVFMLSSGFIKPNTEVVEPTGRKASFAEFLSHFDKIDMPFSVNLNNKYVYENQKKTKLKKVSKKAPKTKSQNNYLLMKNFIPEIKSGMFSRSGPPAVIPIARFYPNDKMIAVIYMTYFPMRSERMSSYNMSLYDLKGKRIQTDKRAREEEDEFDLPYGFNLAYNSYQKTESFSIDEQGQIWKKTYKNIWKNNVKETGFIDNEIIGYDLEKTNVFDIHSNGLVEESKSYKVDDRASLD